jgi:Bacterial protein of unknown function (DUF948)
VTGIEIAALIAAGFFALGVCVFGYLMLRLARLISEATSTLADYRGRADALVGQAQAAVDRAHQQLARTDAITASMDEVTANLAELSGHVSALAGLARGMSAWLGTPLLRLAALGYGFRRAIALRRQAPARALADRGALPPGGGRREAPR